LCWFRFIFICYLIIGHNVLTGHVVALIYSCAKLDFYFFFIYTCTLRQSVINNSTSIKINTNIWVRDCCILRPAISWREQVNFQSDDDEVHFSCILIMPAHWNKSAGRHVVPLGHIILIPSQLEFARTHLCCVLSGEATNINFIVFGLTRSGLEPTIYRTRAEHANPLKPK
jgi:hypothetical protein